MKIRHLAALTAFALLLTAASPAFAQRANGPYSGLFGGPPDVNRWQGLDLHGGLFGSWDDNIVPQDSAANLDPRLKESGASFGVNGSLDYFRRGDRTQFVLEGGADARKYASSPDFVAAYHAGTMFSASPTPRLMLTAGGGAAYSPFFQFAPFQSAGVVDLGALNANFAYAALDERNVSLDATAGLTDNFTSRTSMYVSASGRDWHLLDRSQNDLRSWGGRAGLRHNLTRNLSVHGGYGVDENQYALPGIAPYVVHSIDVGVDYGTALRLARRTTFAFSTSTGVIRYGGENHFRLNGSARLARGFGRSGSAWIGYDRAMEFMIGFNAPLLTDSASAGIEGQIASRVKLSAGAGYTHGTIGFQGSDFNTYSGVGRADIALTRSLAFFGQYLYYHYGIPPGSSVLGLVPRYSRQVAAVGLTVWIPLINDVRAPKQPG